MAQEHSRELVGPVLQRGHAADAVVAAIVALNEEVQLLDRGAYIRVYVPGRCVVTRVAIEQAMGHRFVLPGDLEAIMSSFKGRLHINEEQVSWEFRRLSW